MNGQAFVRKRALIESRDTTEAKRRKALAHLVEEAGAWPVVVDGKLVAYRLPGGFTACEKRRYRDEAAALAEIDGMRLFQPVNHKARLPVRAYFCSSCLGWHVTSQPRAANDNEPAQ